MKFAKLFIIALGLLVLPSCTTVSAPMSRTMPSASRAGSPANYHMPSIPRQDIAHVVAPGETLWRISKIYNVKINDIVRANHLGKSNALDMGQELLIPNALPASPVITLYPSKKWKYIIVHHSATDQGCALAFYNSHKRRGFINGLGYHFVIDNGTSGKADGYIEVSPRWIKQQNGAHCKASGMNYQGIGICLVGNFNESQVSEKQLSSLVYLVNLLRRHYRIPIKNIMGHGQVAYANTDCPGKKFPWKRFLKRLQ